jgi:hypothetical protein
MLSGFFLPAAVTAILMVVGFYPVGSALPRSVFWSSFGASVAVFCIATVIVAAAPIYTLLCWSWRPLVLALFFAICVVVGLVPGLMAGRYVQFGRLSLFSARSANLIKAITDYERVTGMPPRDLEALVPDYLPSTAMTGMAIQAYYRYGPHSGPCPVNNSWHLVVYLPEFLSVYRVLYCPNQDYGRVDASRERRMFGAWMYDLDADASW